VHLVDITQQSKNPALQWGLKPANTQTSDSLPAPGLDGETAKAPNEEKKDFPHLRALLHELEPQQTEGKDAASQPKQPNEKDDKPSWRKLLGKSRDRV